MQRRIELEGRRRELQKGADYGGQRVKRVSTRGERESDDGREREYRYWPTWNSDGEKRKRWLEKREYRIKEGGDGEKESVDLCLSLRPFLLTLHLSPSSLHLSLLNAARKRERVPRFL